MTILSLKIQLRATLLSGGGYELTAPAPGDLTALGRPGGIAGIGDLNGDGLPDLILGTPGSNDKAVDAGRVFVTLGQAAPRARHRMSRMGRPMSSSWMGCGRAIWRAGR